jgi:hypothetical protein
LNLIIYDVFFVSHSYLSLIIILDQGKIK